MLSLPPNAQLWVYHSNIFESLMEGWFSGDDFSYELAVDIGDPVRHSSSHSPKYFILILVELANK